MRELEIVEQLVLGLDPAGRRDPLGTPKDPALDKARALYYEQLKRVAKQHAADPPSAPEPLPAPGGARQGQRWTIAEDNRLALLWEASPAPVRQLSEKLGRSPLAIVSRLVHLGLYEQQQAAMQADNARMQALDLPPLWDVPAAAETPPAKPAAPPAAGKQGAVWTVADDQQLKTLWHSPAQPDSQAIAKQLGRSRGAILARLVRLGLFSDREAAYQADQARLTG